MYYLGSTICLDIMITFSMNVFFFFYFIYAYNRWGKSFPQFGEDLSSSRGKFDHPKSKYRKQMKILHFIFSYIYFYLIVMERSKCFNSNNNSLYLNYKLTQVIFFRLEHLMRHRSMPGNAVIF